MADVKLIAGFTRRSGGRASYAGALRATPKGVPAWLCKGPGHDHLTPGIARKCAEQELERRKQGIREVFELLHCEPEDRWFADARGVTACPSCSVPLERVKVAVLERSPVVDPRSARL